MKVAVVRIALGLFLASGLAMADLFSDDGVATLPTLLIKGEVVSVDTVDTAILLKVKDRYGFETPIYLKEDTVITQGETESDESSIVTGSDVEVEYNFDVNTAKRHAVTVKMPALEPVVDETPALDQSADTSAAIESVSQGMNATAEVAQEQAAEAMAQE